jgi:zinc/manganese transport system substrate-binding protein
MRSRSVFIIGGIVVILMVASLLFVSLLRSKAPQDSASSGRMLVIGAESEYANVLAQIGGRYVHAVGIMTNPNIDPHTYEASTVNATAVARAALIVQNGMGYDAFMQTLEAAAPNPQRIVLVAAQIVGNRGSRPNPHVWYRPHAMQSVASAVAQSLGRLEPQHKAYFRQRLAAFDRSLAPWAKALAQLRSRYAGTEVVVTEPVADYLLQAAGLRIGTPWAFQVAIMNGQDPSPQDVATVESLIARHKAAVLVYNYQAVAPTTAALLTLAKQHGVPVVGVYETMPSGYNYQRWMLAETEDLHLAIAQHKSEVLVP